MNIGGYMKKVVVVLEGGAFINVLADVDIEVTVVDLDTDELYDEELAKLPDIPLDESGETEKGYVWRGMGRTVSTETIEKIISLPVSEDKS